MSGAMFDFHSVVEPRDAGHRLRLDAALEDEALAIVLLTYGRLTSERRRFTVYLSVREIMKIVDKII